jgi:hypothetical protein
MKTFKLLVFLFSVLSCQLVLAGETNKISTNSLAVANVSTNVQSKVVEVLKKEPELPGQSRMDFGTVVTEVPSKKGRDTFALSLMKKGSSSFDFVVLSEYSLTSVNPEQDSIAAGMRWNWKFR